MLERSDPHRTSTQMLFAPMLLRMHVPKAHSLDHPQMCDCATESLTADLFTASQVEFGKPPGHFSRTSRKRKETALTAGHLHFYRFLQDLCMLSLRTDQGLEAWRHSSHRCSSNLLQESSAVHLRSAPQSVERG